VRKEIALVAMAHRTTYVAQGSISNPTHLIESFIEGINAKRPALFNMYSPCMPEQGIADDLAEHQSKLAVESRAYPLMRYNPDKGILPEECFDLDGNPSIETDWPEYSLEYTDEQGQKDSMTVPLTFADFAVTEGRFRKQFRTVPRDAWNDNMVPLHEYLELDGDDDEGKFPFIWAVNAKNRLIRVIPAEPLVKSCEDRRNFWRMLKSLAGVSASRLRQYRCRSGAGGVCAEPGGAFDGDWRRAAIRCSAAVPGGLRRRRRLPRAGCHRANGATAITRAVDRFGAVHVLRRMHRDQPEDLRLRRSQTRLREECEGRSV
jgi:hypothetical protein